MKHSPVTLRERYAEFVHQREEQARIDCTVLDRDNLRKIGVLARRGVLTVDDLVHRFSDLSREQQHFASWLFTIWKVRRAVPVLLESLDDSKVRLSIASALGFMRAGVRVERVFLRHAWRELTSTTPDHLWLDACLYGLHFSKSPQAAEVIVSVFERVDLPGWLRGNAGDKLGCVARVHDHRTSVYRRSRDGALRGITEESIDVQFWSMYVIAQLSTRFGRGVSTALRRDLGPALPRLREIARSDHRMSPGFWWPMSAEAEDAIACIEHGHLPESEACERFPSRG